MRTYAVTMDVTGSITIYVEADDEDMACDIANEMPYSEIAEQGEFDVAFICPEAQLMEKVETA